MKNAAIITFFAVSAATVSAQGDGAHQCAKPNAAYCAGSSLGTDIIIRCDSEGKPQPGRCSDNLAGEPPVGNTPALCWQTDENSGDAACEKNCVVYGGSGNHDGDFTLPADVCTPTFTASQPTATNSTGGHGTGTSTGGHGTGTGIPSTSTSVPSRNETATGTHTGPNTGTHTGTLITPTKTTGPTIPTSAPTAGARANAAAGVLAAVGIAAACLL